MGLQLRRGTNAERLSITPLQGELVFTTDTKAVYVGDGQTVGGIAVTAFTAEDAQDAVSLLFSHGTHSGITFSYNDFSNSISATVTKTYALSTLTDVAVVDPQPGQTLQYNGEAWTNSTHIGALTSLIDVGVVDPQPGQVLKFNGVSWSNAADTDTDTGILSVEDDTTPSLGGNLNLNSFNVNGTGNINITGTITTPKLTITGNKIVSDGVSVLDLVTPTSNGVAVRSVTNGTFENYPALYIRASRGTVDAPTNTEAGDPIGQLVIEGYFGGQFKSLGIFGAQWDAAATLSDAQPKSNTYFTSHGGGSIINYAVFDSKGALTAPIFKATSYATGSLPSSPEEGWMVFDSTTKQFKGWNGTAWVVLG